VRFSWLFFLALIVMLPLACSSGPSEVYEEMVAAAGEGNLERFTAHFSEESKGLVKGLIQLTGAYGGDKKNPLKLIGGGRVIRERPVPCPEETRGVYTSCNELTIQQGSRYRKLLFVESDAGWVIDLRVLETFWKDKRNFSF
jgi:hypothetical protein